MFALRTPPIGVLVLGFLLCLLIPHSTLGPLPPFSSTTYEPAPFTGFIYSNSLYLHHHHLRLAKLIALCTLVWRPDKLALMSLA
jgi:hypothetical protein